MAMFRNVNLAPIDTSGFERAGAAYGQMFQNLGDTVADTIEAYNKKKEDKKKLRSDTQFWESQINPQTGENFSPELAKTLAKNPELADQKRDLQKISLLMEQNKLEAEQYKRNVARQNKEDIISEGIAAYSSGNPINDFDQIRYEPYMPQIEAGVRDRKLRKQSIEADIAVKTAQARPDPIQKGEYNSTEEASEAAQEFKEKGFGVEVVSNKNGGADLKLTMDPENAKSFEIPGFENYLNISGSVYEKGDDGSLKKVTADSMLSNKELSAKIATTLLSNPEIENYNTIKSVATNADTAQEDGFYRYKDAAGKNQEMPVNPELEKEVKNLTEMLQGMLKELNNPTPRPPATSSRFTITEE